MTQNKLRVKGVNSGGGTYPSMLYNIDAINDGPFQFNHIRYDANQPQILTNVLQISTMGRNGDNFDLLQIIQTNQLIRITQEGNPSIYQQFRVMGGGQITKGTNGVSPISPYITYPVAFDVFTISDFPHDIPVIVTVV